jgi:uncharacterized protein
VRFLNRAERPRVALAVVAATLLAAGLLAAGKEDRLPPKPDRYVTDRAGVLSPDRAEALNSRLEQFEQDTSNQLLVWIDRRVPEDFALEEFTVAAARKWAAGQAGRNNGVVLFVFTEDRKMRIEVGYGLEGAIPDATAHRIQEDEILPRFRQSDYAGGVEAGAAALMAAAKGEYKGTGVTVDQRRRRASGTSVSGCGGFPLLFFLFFFLFPLLFRARRGWRTYGGGGFWTSGWGGGGGGGGGFGGGGGGFSGGGGSFGGGGSSGSW